MAKKDDEVVEEPTLEDLEEEDSEEVPSDTEEEKEEIETESLEARVEKEKKIDSDESDQTEGSFISVEAAEKRNIKKSDLKDDEVVKDIQEDEFTCTVCYLVLKRTQLEKPRAKVCIDCA